MRILRALALLLVLGNVLLFALASGLLGGGGGGEPERLAHQLDAQKIVILKAGADAVTPPPAVAEATPKAEPEATPKAEPPAAKPEAPPKPPEPEVCRRYPALAREKANKVVIVARQQDLKVAQKSQDEPSAWWVHLPPQASREDVDKNIGELRGAGVSDFFVVQEQGPNHFAISLGLFKQERMAMDLRDRLRAKGIAQARVTPRENANAKVALELRGTRGQMDALLSQAVSSLAGASAQNCGR